MGEKLTSLGANSKPTDGGKGGKDTGLLGTRGKPGWGWDGHSAGGLGANEEL